MFELRTGWGVLLVGALLASGCGPAESSVTPTRGYILVSVDTLRADHLGLHGYERDTSPFLDSLASRSVVFDNAIVQLPGTLPSHMSMLTGLYPGEHGVYPPDGALAAEIETVAEVFRRNGYRTAGFTEGGYMDGDYGFSRGFDRFDDEPKRIDETFGLGVEFIEALAAEEPFFLFLHSYSVHDPYDPPEPYRHMFWPGDPPDSFAPTGRNLVAVNRGERTVDPETVRYFEALYDAGIREMDAELGSFFERLADAGVLDEVTVVITSDHGEEFLEHGQLVHEQIYFHTLHVPLVVAHPTAPARGRTVQSLVQSIDIAPMLLDMAGLTFAEERTGRSLVPHLAGAAEAAESEAYAEAFMSEDRTILHRGPRGFFQLVRHQPNMAAENGFWVGDELTFESLEPRVEFEAVSYYEPRSLTVEVAGDRVGVFEIGTGWTEVAFDVPAADAKPAVRFTTSSCDSPAELGLGADSRCLAFKMRGYVPATTELFDVESDPEQVEDLSRAEPGLHADLLRRLESLVLETVASGETLDLNPALERRLRALGYLR